MHITLESALGTLCSFCSCVVPEHYVTPTPWKIIGNSEGVGGGATSLHVIYSSKTPLMGEVLIFSGKTWCTLGYCRWCALAYSTLLDCVSVCLGTVHDIVNRGGRCLIPVFALGRAQELLLILGMLICRAYWCWTLYVCAFKWLPKF